MSRPVPLAQKMTPVLYINKPDFGAQENKENKARNFNARQPSQPLDANLNADKEDDEDESGAVGSKETNKSEGEKLFQKQEYRKAIDCFTMALERDTKNPDPKCLVWRSRCWLRLGRNDEALADSEAALSASSDNIHGLLIKAQVLFEIGDFEFALVQFHRGNKLRPELELFRKGIQCCEEVIANCVGDSDHKLTLDGDLSFLDKVHPQIHFMDEEEKKKKENINKSYNANANAKRLSVNIVVNGVNNNNDDDDNNNDNNGGGQGFEDENELDPLDAVAAANAGNDNNNAATVGDENAADGGNAVEKPVHEAGADAMSADVPLDVPMTTTMTATTTTRKRTLPPFIYEDAAYNAADDDVDAAREDAASGAASPRFRTEAGVRAAVNDAASVSSFDWENDNYNANANANANAEEAGKAGGAVQGRKVLIPVARRNYNENCGICKRPPRTEKAKDEEGVRKWKQPKTCKMLLGELYKDRMYLESLLEDGDLIEPSYPVHKTAKREITKAINYLDAKADYWQRYKPIYARVGDKGVEKKRATGEELAMQIQRALEEIDQAHSEHRWDDCLSKARLLLANSPKWSSADIVNKRVVISALHNYMGVSYTELRRFDRGLREHIMDLEEVSREPVLLENKSRALENMGKVYAKMGNYTKALLSWQQKEPLCKSDYENAWVCHEIGRAYLEMGNFARSRQSSIKAYKFAVACGDSLWMLHASVLQAQTEAKMGELQSAYETFGVALNHANEVGDDQAAPAIRRALKDIKLRLVRRGQDAAGPGGGGDNEGGDGEGGEDDDGGDGGGGGGGDGDDEGNAEEGANENRAEMAEEGDEGAAETTSTGRTESEDAMSNNNQERTSDDDETVTTSGERNED